MAFVNGGGIYIGNGNFYFSGGIIESCSAVRGGGIYVDGPTEAVVSGTIVRSNSASDAGGGVYYKAGPFRITEATFDGNLAAGLGDKIAAAPANPIPALVVENDCVGVTAADIVWGVM